MRKLALLSLLLACLFLTGCPRYDTVRKLSTEQLRVQQEFQSTMTKYFASMEQFAANQVVVDKMYYDDLLTEDIDNHQERFDKEIKKIKDDQQKSADQKADEIRDKSIEFGKRLEKKRAENATDKAELDVLLQEYKEKNKQILVTYQAILDAQVELDRYVQLKKFDEVITEQLFRKVGDKQRDLTRLFDEAAKIADKIKLKPAPPQAAQTN
ncbi:MAG TPA: hypothetical protein VN282_14805 [Pyrinomonadaceae bacterium]|nr:hypothetical protein [Pyrinomonadaceae bacterium]